ncbi:MAG: OmpH family outer membrane protein [Rhodanobacteraceae bacterium]|jgi:outer membrane protein|nr:OmpH family outer membrane protein [Rhodanobacteraceae bacterium]MBL0041899.1 OmpH family outer membrane protein [Xanthomonadales bacterium]MBP6078338.1 OmpH family outer membrane protein [Xanthomonadales bacterium]MBP7625072.1 OmpH family outer membrane protein [Xanthomonadales bacterium]
MADCTAPKFRRCAGLILAGAFLLLSAATAVAQSARIGYVDMKRLIDNAPQVLDTRRKLESEFSPRNKALESEQTRLVELEARDRRDSAILPKAAADSLKREIDALRKSIERTRKRLAEEFKARGDEEFNRQWPRIEAAVIAHARENQLDLVVQAPVMYASAQIDITDAVLARLKRDAAATPER